MRLPVTHIPKLIHVPVEPAPAYYRCTLKRSSRFHGFRYTSTLLLGHETYISQGTKSGEKRYRKRFTFWSNLDGSLYILSNPSMRIVNFKMDHFYRQVVRWSIFFESKHGMRTHVSRKHNNLRGTWHTSILHKNPPLSIWRTIKRTRKRLRVDRITDA